MIDNPLIPELHNRVHSLEKWRKETDEEVRSLRDRADRTDEIVLELDDTIKRLELKIGNLATRDDFRALATQAPGVPVVWFIGSLVVIFIAVLATIEMLVR